MSHEPQNHKLDIVPLLAFGAICMAASLCVILALANTTIGV